MHGEQKVKSTVIISGEFVAEERRLFSELKQNRSCHEVNEDQELEAVATRWLITEDTDFCEQGLQIFVPSHDGSFSFGDG
jgi:3-deoxy-D-manno-octulosonic-acid transferase